MTCLPWRFQISGGSGITPMLQVVQEVLRHPEDRTEVSLIFANISDKDILLKQTFDDLAAKHRNFKARDLPSCCRGQLPLRTCAVAAPHSAEAVQYHIEAAAHPLMGGC